MKILHLISQRPDSTGSGIYLQAILREADRAGYENSLLAGLPAGEQIFLPGLTADRMSFVYFGSRENPGAIIGMSDVMPYPSRTFRQLDRTALEHYLQAFKSELVDAVDRYRPDIIHTHHLWLVTALARTVSRDIPVVTSVHGSELRQFTQCPLLHELVLPGCRLVDRVFALTDAQKIEISSTYGISSDRIRVVGAGYDPNIFHAGQGTCRTAPPAILFAGKLSRAKGVPWMIQAIAEFNDRPCHLHLAGGGSGPELQLCLDYARRLGDRVTLHGQLSQVQLADLMRRSSVFVLPSLHEGLPLSIIEAVACGCQAVACNLPGCRAIADNLEPGRLILVDTPRVIDTDRSEIDDERRFVAQLRSAMATQLNIPEASPPPSRCLAEFSWTSVFRRIEQEYRVLLDDYE